MKRGAKITYDDISESAGKVLDFTKEAAGYIEDELAQGYGLDQIKKELINEGYPKDLIDSAVNKVEEDNKISDKDREKVIERSDKSHMKRRFHMPVLSIGLFIAILLITFFFLGVGEKQQIKAPEIIDVLLYEDLGISFKAKIVGSEQTYSRDEIAELRRAEAFIREHKDNKLLANLKTSDAVKGFNKRLTVFSIVKAGVEERTLVEIRFRAERDIKTLKIVESIPKSTATYEEILLTQRGVVAEKDPVLIFTFNNVKSGDVLKAVYVIKKKVSKPNSMTFSAEEKETALQPKPNGVCGDGKCVVGESYVTCCTDCGCLPKFRCERNKCVAEQRDKCKTDWECEDEDISTQDKCEGSPKKCTHKTITQCEDADMYCPAGCTYDEDNDCEPPAEETAVEEKPNITGLQESPKISEAAITPETAKIGEKITVTAKVSDANGQEDIEKVWFEVLELAQTKGEEQDMNDKGEEGDAAAGDGIYTGRREVAEYYLKGAYHITIFARDRSGNQKKFQKMFWVGEGPEKKEDAEMTDCGTDFECFIDAAEGCSPSKVTNTISMTAEGMTETDAEYYEIRGEEVGKCVFYIRTESIDVTFSDDLKQEMLNEGYTEEDIVAEENTINDEANNFEGDDGECRFDTEDLVEMLKKWAQGNVEQSDFDSATCNGPYFS